MDRIDPDDRELLRRFISGQADAFTELVRRYLDLVYSVALRQLKDSHQAEDATQIVFALLARRAGDLADGVVVPGWLVQTVRFVSLDLMRTRRAQLRKEQQAARDQSMIGEPPNNFASDQTIISQRLDEAISGLKEKDRNVIVLRYFCNEPSARIGAMLGMTEAVAAKRLSRAIAHLRRLMTSSGTAAIGEPMLISMLSRAVQQAPPGLVERVSMPTSTIASRAADLARHMPGRSISAKGLITMAASTKLEVVAIAVLIAAAIGGVGTVVYRWSHGSQNDTVILRPHPAATIDLRTPQAAFGSVISAVNAEDLDALTRCLWSSDPQELALMKAWAAATISAERVNDAMYNHFGDAGLRITNSPAYWPSAIPRPMPDAPITMEATNDQKVVYAGSDKIGWGRFIRTDANWQLDVITSYGSIDRAQMTQTLNAATERGDYLVNALNSGKVKTFGEAYSQRMTCGDGYIFINRDSLEPRPTTAPAAGAGRPINGLAANDAGDTRARPGAPSNR